MRVEVRIDRRHRPSILSPRLASPESNHPPTGHGGSIPAWAQAHPIVRRGLTRVRPARHPASSVASRSMIAIPRHISRFPTDDRATQVLGAAQIWGNGKACNVSGQTPPRAGCECMLVSHNFYIECSSCTLRTYTDLIVRHHASTGNPSTAAPPLQYS